MILIMSSTLTAEDIKNPLFFFCRVGVGGLDEREISKCSAERQALQRRGTNCCQKREKKKPEVKLRANTAAAAKTQPSPGRGREGRRFWESNVANVWRAPPRRSGAAAADGHLLRVRPAKWQIPKCLRR